jgi:hypothetical protein
MVLDKVCTTEPLHGLQYERLCLRLSGQLTLRKLRLKKGALDKFRLPVDVIEGEF